MAPSSPNVSAPSSASTLPTTQTSSATPRSLPDCRNTAPGTRKMPEPIVVPTTMSTRSRSVRTRRSSAGTCNSVRTTSSAEPRLCGGEGVDQAGEVLFGFRSDGERVAHPPLLSGDGSDPRRQRSPRPAAARGQSPKGPALLSSSPFSTSHQPWLPASAVLYTTSSHNLIAVSFKYVSAT